MAIRTFRDKASEAVFRGKRAKGVPSDLVRRLAVRLAVLDNAEGLNQLAALPGSNFEALAGDRQGQYSIRVNKQWRVCFRWRDGDAYDVEFVDYH